MTKTRDDGDREGRKEGKGGHLCHVRALSLFPRIYLSGIWRFNDKFLGENSARLTLQVSPTIFSFKQLPNSTTNAMLTS